MFEPRPAQQCWGSCSIANHVLDLQAWSSSCTQSKRRANGEQTESKLVSCELAATHVSGCRVGIICFSSWSVARGSLPGLFSWVNWEWNGCVAMIGELKLKRKAEPFGRLRCSSGWSSVSLWSDVQPLLLLAWKYFSFDPNQ